jgi:hypothetical protein
MVRKRHDSGGGLEKPVTMGDLGKFTDEVILPGVEKIVDGKISPLREEMKAGFAEMRQGFKDVNNSIRVLSGEIIELKEREKEQKHEVRIRRLEEKVGFRPRN